MGGSLFVMDLCDLYTARLCLSENVDYLKGKFSYPVFNDGHTGGRL